jgi:hypothetical protein
MHTRKVIGCLADACNLLYNSDIGVG